jgi:hypothetical protein
MKRTTLSLFAAGFLAAVVMSSCGEKYTPLTAEEQAAKADSIFNATATELRAEKEAACEAELQAKVDAKVQELTAAATAAATPAN